MTIQPERIIICGAGLAGCLLAVELAQAGHVVVVLEKRSDPRVAGAVGGRSINLAISARGLAALQRAGLKETLLMQAVPMPGRQIHVGDHSFFQPYSRTPNRAINSMSRGGLNAALIVAADAFDTVTIHFDSAIEDIDLEKTCVTTVNGEVFDGALIVGADGAFSVVRQKLQTIPRFNFSQSYLPHGYKELFIPATESGPHQPFQLEPNALHVWPHGSSMMIALPNFNGSFTCTLFWPFEGEHSFEAVTPTNVRAFFESNYPDAARIMPTLEEDFAKNPTSTLATMRCCPWSRGNIVLIGDAAHAVVPFYGQGANAAFEDCSVLADCLAAHPGNTRAAIEAYETARIDNANAIADMAIANFLDMRDHSGSAIHRWQKKGSQFLGTLAPGLWTPLYDMISFTSIPYAAAQAKAMRQARVLCWIAVVFLVAIGVLLWRCLA